VEAHGGRVALVPAQSGGARFVVVLPATDAADG
jgi:signal transduction histidine kinase